MIGLDSFIIGSILIYLSFFYVMAKLPLHNVIKIFITGIVFAGSYLNISQNGNIVKWLNIELTDEIRILSFIIVLIYLITMFVLFKDKTMET